MRFVVTIDDDPNAIFFAMTHNPKRCPWCAILGERIQEHMNQPLKGFNDAPRL